MLSQEDTPTQIYIPALRREIVSRALPETVLFLDPGLPQTATLPGFFHPAAYPFSPNEAARVLDELLSIGETLDLSSALGSQAARISPGHDQDDEKAALARFSAARPAEPKPAKDPKIAAQKVLLLAWDLETRILEIADLHREVALAAKPLQENLHGQAGIEEYAKSFPGESPENPAELSELPEPDWRPSLAAMAAFIPAGALLVTCHPGIRAVMMGGGMLHPLPEDVAERLVGWPEMLQSRLLWAQTPLWRVLGYSRELANAPWLLAAPEIVVCPA